MRLRAITRPAPRDAGRRTRPGTRTGASIAPHGDGIAMPGAATRLLLAFGVLLHLVLASTTGLSPDEAHYALYGAHPAWSYFDHPPLVGWLQAIFASAGGGDVAMRIVPMTAWVAAVLASLALGRALPLAGGDAAPESPARRARRDAWVVALLLASPLLDLLGVALVPDTLLLPLVPAAMLLTWRLRDPARARRLSAWIALGLVLAACVLAKYTGVFAVAGSLAMLARFHGRRLPALPGFHVAALLVIAGAAPVIGWNLAHGWMSFTYQSAHVAGARSWSIAGSLRAGLLQLVAYGPLVLVAAWRQAVVLRRAGAAPPAVRDAQVLVLAFGLPLMAVALALAGRGTSLPHWTASGWIALVPLAAAGCLDGNGRWPRRLLVAQGAILALLVGLVAAGGLGGETGEAATSPPGAHARDFRPNPVADVYGWNDAAVRAVQLARQLHADRLAVMNWSLASRLAWYGRPMPVQVVPPRVDQFSLWFGTIRPGDSALVVDWSQMTFPPPTGPDAFARCTPVDTLATVHAGRQVAHFDYLLCEGWRTGLAAH